MVNHAVEVGSPLGDREATYLSTNSSRVRKKGLSRAKWADVVATWASMAERPTSAARRSAAVLSLPGTIICASWLTL
jgi:hypothetical protein